MSGNTTKKERNIKGHSTTGCLATNKPGRGELRTIKANTTSKKHDSCITRDARSGQSVSQKSPRNETTSVKDKSKADKMFERAWKDTYEKRERRIG